MFFQAINRMITAGTDLSFSIRQVNNRLTVAVMPRRTGLKGEAGGQIVPLVLNGKHSINSPFHSKNVILLL